MDLQLSRRADYGVRAAVLLARAWGDGTYRKVREISTAMSVPRSFTPQVLGDLVRAGLVDARAGREGGYRLSRSPSEISLLEVVEASEGVLLPQRCTLRGTDCDPANPCLVHPAWFEAAQALRSSLAGAMLDRVVLDAAAGTVPGSLLQTGRPTARSTRRPAER